ncbi:hypothetical protein ACQPW3_27530 [Actinosynnema sp. CA-248983]
MRGFLGAAPDGFDELAWKTVREQVRRSPRPAGDERSSGDSAG